jgi:hypothetical protein
LPSDNDGERRPDAELYAHRLWDVEQAKDFVQHRNNDGAAANAEQSGEKTSDDAGAQNSDCKPDQLAGGQSHPLPTLISRRAMQEPLFDR